MSRQITHPKWWQVYLTFPLLIGLFYFDSRLKLSVRGHQIVQLVIILLVYGLIHLWLKANAIALERESTSSPFVITRVLVSASTRNPYHQLTASEIKGVLDDTFEMDIIDAEFLPMEEASPNWKEEKE